MPVISIARVGEHAAATWNEVKRSPPGALARESMAGVCISEPKVLQSLKPRSSATIIRKLGGILALRRCSGSWRSEGASTYFIQSMLYA